MDTSGRHLCCAILVCLVLLLLSPASVATTPHTELFRSPNGRFELRLLSDFDKGKRETWQLVDTSTGSVRLTMHEILSFSIGFLSDDGQYLAQLRHTFLDPQQVLVRLWHAGRVRSEFTIGDLRLDPRYFIMTSVGLEWFLSPCRDCPLPFSFKDNLLVVTTNEWRRLTFDVARGTFLGSEPVSPTLPGDVLVYGFAVLSRPELPGVISRRYSLTPRCVLTGDVPAQARVPFEIPDSEVQKTATVRELQDLLLPNVPVVGLFEIRGGLLVGAWGVTFNRCMDKR